MISLKCMPYWFQALCRLFNSSPQQKKKKKLTAPWTSFHLAIPNWHYHIQFGKGKAKTKPVCQTLTQEIEWAKHCDACRAAHGGARDEWHVSPWQDLPPRNWNQCRQADNLISDMCQIQILQSSRRHDKFSQTPLSIWIASFLQPIFSYSAGGLLHKHAVCDLTATHGRKCGN